LNTERYRLALAESLLRTVTSDAQAASIAGDLLEDRHRGQRRFATDLCTTFLGLSLQALAGTPLRHAAWLGLTACLWALAYLAVRLGFAWSGWLALSGHTGDCLAAGGVRGVLLAAALALAGLITGTVTARLARHRRQTLTAVLPLAAVFLAAAPALALADLLSGALSWHCLLTYLLLAPLCYVLPLLLGSMLGSAATRSSPLVTP